MWGRCSILKKLYECIGRAELFIAKSSLAILTALVFLAAIARTLRNPIGWGVDTATFLFAWCVFLSGDIALRNNKLVSIDLVVSKFPKKLQFYIKLLNHLIIITFLVALIGFGFWLSYTTRFRTFQGIPGFSYTWVTLSVPVGSVLMLTTMILKIKFLIKGGIEYVEEKGNSKEFL